MSKSTTTDDPGAEELFAQFLERIEVEPSLSLEEWVKDHPEHASHLRSLYNAYGRLQPHFPDGGAGPTSGSSRAFFRRSDRERPQPAPGLAAGKTVGDFRLVSLLGQGGMGQVWEAEQISLHRTVAVKFVRPERVTERQLELFAREARAGGRLSHVGIVTVYAYGQSEGLAWIAMEFVSGAWTLKDFLDEAVRGEELPEGYDRHVARFVAEIADAMQAAHEAHVIHRDLKPQNVLITEDDRPKVTDFGLARISDESALSKSGDIAGTYLYMSPEQLEARRSRVDHRTDVFSLGVVLYELLALRRPFEGDTMNQVAAQILTKDPPGIRTIRSRVPRDLAVIAGKALEKDRDKRFQTMDEFANDLHRHLANKPIHARSPTGLERAVKWTKRNPGKSAAAGIVSVTFTVIALLLAANVRTNRALERSNVSLEARTMESEQRRVAAEEAAELARSNEGRAVAGETLAKENAARADREAGLAKQNARIATERADDVLRLSALQKLEDLTTEADRLWPPYPDKLSKYEDWMRRATELMAELPDHEAKLAELRARSVPWTEEEQARRRAEVSGRPERLFTDAQDKWWHHQLEKLVQGLGAFSDPAQGLFSEGISAEHGWGIPRRAAFAWTIKERSITGPEPASRWSEAIASIADPKECPEYGGLRISPQLGLLPIGRDPASGLWEFAHLQTGEPAERGADGKLAQMEETGLVFVLLPRGAFQIGAQKSDPNGPNYDPQAAGDEGPVHAVTLSPFFLSKYEMTQGQWARSTGNNPSSYQPSNGYASSLMHPVEQVNWVDSRSVMEHLGLSLPSELQWEFGARGGTGSVWWTGNDRESLRNAANLADQAAKQAGADWPDIEDWPELDDGYAVHAPVGVFRANAFGLFDVHGNVWEWCQDDFDKVPVAEPEISDRVARGGSWYHAAVSARSANRHGFIPSSAANSIGLRPARPIRP